jgi:hypothetical protein
VEEMGSDGSVIGGSRWRSVGCLDGGEMNYQGGEG